MKTKTWLILLLLNIAGLTFFQCKDKVVEKGVDEPLQLRAQTAPESTLLNFKDIYNFCNNGIDVERAIELYRDCFSNDNGLQYEFKYTDITSGALNPSPCFMSYAEETSATAALFREVAGQGLNLKLQEFRAVSFWVEIAADTAIQEIKHPGEDWYIYQMNAYLLMDNPNPADNPYLVQGQGTFCVRRCSDGKYRIVRWADHTYEDIFSPKIAKTQGVGKTYSESSWGSIKSLYR
jgi:hypothetical protein